MRLIAQAILTTAAALAAGTAAAHPGHATLGPLAGALHLHALDVALALLAVALLALLAPSGRQRLAEGLPALRALAASGRVRALAGALAAAVVLMLLFG